MRHCPTPRSAWVPSLVFALCLWGWGALAQWTNAARSIEELRAQIQAHVTAPRFNGALWSLEIASLDTGKTIYAHHPHRLMSPASNSKLYTGALALDHFGSDYRITTSILATTQPNRTGDLAGDVVVVGRGDPSWKPGADSTNFWALFDPFVAALTNAGVHRITGDIVADATYFRGPPTGASWTVDDLQDYYGAEISAITLMDNLAQLRVTPGDEAGQPCTLEMVQPLTGLTLDNRTTTATNGGPNRIETYRLLGRKLVVVSGQMPEGAQPRIEDLTVPRPADWFAAALKEALVRHGIRVDGTARSVRWPEPSAIGPDLIVLGEIFSPPLRELVRAFMKPSQNLEADLIFDHVGETTRTAATPARRTSEQLAVTALKGFLRTNGLPADDLHFDEGSGLSRNNLTSAALTMGLLRFMTTHPASNDFFNALPIAGVDGTLRRRMKGTPAEGNVHAKTGTLRWVNALSGYVTSAAKERFVFSLLLNRNVAAPGRSGRMELDDIAVMLARFKGRSDTTLESLYAPQGQLILAPFANAPFPHPERAEGHVYRGQLYRAAEHYSDNTVALFVPKGFQETDAVDFVVYFHGWRNCAIESLARSRLIEQFSTSRKNAVLVVPTGPFNAPDSFGGKLEEKGGFTRFMDEVVTRLRDKGVLANSNTRIGNIVLCGHSGGYRVIAKILGQDSLAAQVKEVWLFDALYAEVEAFLDWQAQQDGRLLILYTDGGGTVDETKRAMGLLRKRGVDYHVANGSNPTTAELSTNRVVFLTTDLAHGEVVREGGYFLKFLETSAIGER